MTTVVNVAKKKLIQASLQSLIVAIMLVFGAA